MYSYLLIYYLQEIINYLFAEPLALSRRNHKIFVNNAFILYYNNGKPETDKKHKIHLVFKCIEKF